MEDIQQTIEDIKQTTEELISSVLDSITLIEDMEVLQQTEVIENINNNKSHIQFIYDNNKDKLPESLKNRILLAISKEFTQIEDLPEEVASAEEVLSFELKGLSDINIVEDAYIKLIKTKHQSNWNIEKAEEYKNLTTKESYEDWMGKQNYKFDDKLLDFDTFMKENGKEYKLQIRNKKLESMTVITNTVEFDANMSAQSNMGDAGTLANWLFNKTITDSLKLASTAPDATNELKYIAGLFEQVYQGVYKDNKINWKGADDKIHKVQGESILEALMKTMTKKGSIIEKDVDGQPRTRT